VRLLEVVYGDPRAGFGVEAFARDLGRCLARKGVEVSFAFYAPLTDPRAAGWQGSGSKAESDGSEAFPELVPLGPRRPLPLFPAKLLYNFLLFGYARDNSSSYDVFHINGDNGAFITLVRGAKTVMTWHGSSSLLASRVPLGPAARVTAQTSSYLECFASRRASAVTVVSPSLLDYVGRAGERKDARVIENFVDSALFSPGDKERERERLDLDGGSLVALWVGGDPVNKRLDFTLDLARKHPEVQFVVAGSSPSRAPPNVRAVGRVPREELVRYYRAADVLVFPSLYEGFGLAALEAMACGCVPIMGESVARGISGLVDGVNCFVAKEDGDYDAVLGRLERDREVLKGMARKAEEVARAHSLEAACSAYLDLFEEVAGSGRRRGSLRKRGSGRSSRRPFRFWIGGGSRPLKTVELEEEAREGVSALSDPVRSSPVGSTAFAALATENRIVAGPGTRSSPPSSF